MIYALLYHTIEKNFKKYNKEKSINDLRFINIILRKRKNMVSVISYSKENK